LSNVYAQEERTISPPDFSSLFEDKGGIVARVVDPLTLQMKDGRILNLAGMDFPDLDYHQPGPLSVLAVKIMRDMLENTQVKIYQNNNNEESRLNRMGHSISHVVVHKNSLWVQAVLLRLGLARVRTTADNYDLATEMYVHEDFARSEKSGLWKIRAYDVHEPDNAHLFTDNFGIVEGTVKNVSIRQGQTFINFGDNWKKDFTLSILRSKRKDFMKAGLDPRDWGGKKIRVRGWLRDYNGPYIEIDHPEALEFLDVKQDSKTEENTKK